MNPTVVERYLRLGLRLDRHVEGVVDSYSGPPELSAAVAAEPPIDPPLLVADADELLAELPDGWLRDQVAGLRTYAGALAGESRTLADEAEGCFGLRPAFTDEAVFEAAHARLDDLLPGDGPLAARYERWEASLRVPAARVEELLAAVVDAARAWTRGVVELPAGEGVEIEIVRDVPWLAYCEYVGGLRSRISVNVDLPLSALDLLVTATHETYPGHHTERCCKEIALVRGRGLLEETLVAVPTPQSLVAEGIAQVGPALLLEGDGGADLAAILHGAGVELDLEHALAVRQALEPCRWAEVNAAFLLHEQGASAETVRAYLERFGLMSPELSAHMIRFLSDPTSRTYVLTYPAGRELCRAYVGGDPARFRRLLTDQLRVRDLVGS